MSDLVDYQVAAVIFTVIVNDQAGITNLSVDQLRKIYTGQYTNWNQLGGPDLQIVAYSRPVGSGTRVTFDRHLLKSLEDTTQKPIGDTQGMVLAVENKPGAIGYASLFDVENVHSQHVRIVSINASQPGIDEVKAGGYLFWNIEHLYTRGPASGLAKAFIDYLGTESAATVIENHSFVSISRLPASLLSSHSE